MIKKLVIAIIVAIFCGIVGTAHDLSDRYEQFKLIAAQSGLNSEAAEFLTQWEKEEPQSAEMLNSWFLYYIVKSTDQIRISDDLANFDFDHNAMLPDTLTCFDKLLTQNINILVDEGDGMKNYTKALEYINKAIEYHPCILELYINKIDGFMRKYEHKYATAEALRLAKTVKKNDAQWLDFNNQPLNPDSAVFMVDHTMFSIITDLLANNETELAMILNDTLMSYYPDEPVYKLNKGEYYIQTGQYSEAINYYQGLLKGNINDDKEATFYLMQLCCQTGDTVNAQKYANELSHCDVPTLVAQANKVIESLKPFTVNFLKIEAWMEDHRAEYDALVERFKACDTGLTYDELSKIYFGHACTEQVTSTTLWDKNAINKLIEDREFDKLYAEARACLDTHPASIAALAYCYLACEYTNQKEDAQKYLTQIYMVIGMIQKDANSTAKNGNKVYKILWRADEDAFVDYIMGSEERSKTSVFMNPMFFLSKDQKDK